MTKATNQCRCANAPAPHPTKTRAMRQSRTDAATEHLASVAGQAATLRAKVRELAKIRADLDRMIVNAYRDHVPASHLAEAAQFSRDTIHAAVRPWIGRKRKKRKPTTR